MLRSLYILLLRLHPTRFRQRFGDEMLLIFDGEHRNARLVADAAVSLLRQWTVRSEFWQDRLASIPVSTDVPSFYSLDNSRPPTRALIHGASLSIIVIGAVILAISYSHNPTVILPQIILPDSARSTARPPVSPSPLTADEQSPREAPSSSKAQRAEVPPSPLPTEGDSVTEQLVGRPESNGIAKPRPLLNASAPDSSSIPGSRIMVPLDPALLRSYAGTYVSDSLNLSLVIKEQAGRLSLEMSAQPPHVLVPVSESRFFVAGLEGQWIEFVRGEDASAVQVIYFGNRNFVAHRRP